MVKQESSKEDNETIQINFGKFFGAFVKNPWIAVSLVLAILLVWTLFFRSGGVSVSGVDVVAPAVVGQNIIEFVKTIDKNQTVSLTSAEVEGALIKVVVSFNGTDVPVYATLDGKYLIPPDALAPLTPPALQ